MSEEGGKGGNKRGGGKGGFADLVQGTLLGGALLYSPSVMPPGDQGSDSAERKGPPFPKSYRIACRAL